VPDTPIAKQTKYVEFAVKLQAVGNFPATYGHTRCLGPLTRVDDLPGRRRTLRSTNANRLVVPPVKLSTVGSRAFALAAPHIWNTLPTDVVAANSLSTFRRLLKRFLSSSHILTPHILTSSRSLVMSPGMLRRDISRRFIIIIIIQLVVLAVVAPLRPL